MNKKLKIIGSLVTGTIVVGLGLFLVIRGIERDDTANIETEMIPSNIEVEATDNLHELTVESVSIHPAGHGLIIWNDEYGKMNQTPFLVSVDNEVELVNDNLTPIDVEDENVHEMLVNSIQEEYKENQRSIYVMEGYMDENRTTGTMQWVSHDREHGEIRFVVEADDEIIFSESDWESLPETDEHTTNEFEAAAKRMIETWGFYDEYLESGENG